MKSIDLLVRKRKRIYDKNHDDKRVDELADVVLKKLYDGKNKLPVDYIIETLTHLGCSPNVYYDDNGHFAVCEEGNQSLPKNLKKCDDLIFTSIIVKRYWKTSIRKALNYYLDDMIKPS